MCSCALALSCFFPFLGDLFPFFASPACLVYVVNLSTTGSLSQDLFTHIDLSHTRENVVCPFFCHQINFGSVYW